MRPIKASLSLSAGRTRGAGRRSGPAQWWERSAAHSGLAGSGWLILSEGWEVISHMGRPSVRSEEARTTSPPRRTMTGARAGSSVRWGSEPRWVAEWPDCSPSTSARHARRGVSFGECRTSAGVIQGWDWHIATASSVALTNSMIWTPHRGRLISADSSGTRISTGPEARSTLVGLRAIPSGGGHGCQRRNSRELSLGRNSGGNWIQRAGGLFRANRPRQRSTVVLLPSASRTSRAG